MPPFLAMSGRSLTAVGATAPVTALLLCSCLGPYLHPRTASAEIHVWLTAESTHRGENYGDFAGSAVAGAGDVNGDGFDDLLVGAYQNNDSGEEAGKAYLIFGQAEDWPTVLDLGLVDGSFLGEAPGDFAGARVGGAGDANGDGFADILIGAPGNDEAGVDLGQSYLIFGNEQGWQAGTSLADSDASFLGERADSYLNAEAGVGDVDGDGIDDLLFGCPSDSENGNDAGQAYLVFGRSSGWEMDADLGTADASFWGEAEFDAAGGRVSSAGDVDGDGFGDLLVSAPHNGEISPTAGQTYLLLGGQHAWTMDQHLAQSDASFVGEGAADWAGNTIAGDGDLDGDGFDDIIIGASFNDEAGENSGQTYVIRGRSSGWAMGATLALSDASFVGEEAHDWAGGEAAIPGDINGDGLDDAIVGAYNANTVYVILGRTSGWEMDASLGDSGAAFVGYGKAGWSIDGAGDVNGDGLADFIVGAPYADGLGRASLLLGSTCWDSDGDGTDSCSGDCDDLDEDINPDAEEVCDGVDNDCSGAPGDDEVDGDGDGVMVCDGDCDDGEPAAFPGNDEDCGDGIDNDCDGDTDLADDECEDSGDDDCAGDDDTTDLEDDDSTEPSGGGCGCRSETAPGGSGGAIALLALIGMRRMGRHGRRRSPAA